MLVAMHVVHATQAVVQNLMISRIEFRDDTNPDVVKYCHPRSREQRLNSRQLSCLIHACNCSMFLLIPLIAMQSLHVHAAQAVVQNLMISRIEFRDDTDPDVVKYCHPRSREQRLVPVCQEGRLTRQLLRKLMTPLAMRLNSEAEVGHLVLQPAHKTSMLVRSRLPCGVNARLFACVQSSAQQLDIGLDFGGCRCARRAA
jgi:ERCC4-related helicase